jgi:hypothetical protein
MNDTALVVAALVILPAFALVLRAWATLAQVENDLRSFDGFEGMHFDI